MEDQPSSNPPPATADPPPATADPDSAATDARLPSATDASSSPESPPDAAPDASAAAATPAAPTTTTPDAAPKKKKTKAPVVILEDSIARKRSKRAKPAPKPVAPVVVPAEETPAEQIEEVAEEPVEDVVLPDPVPPPTTDPMLLSALILLRGMHDQGEFALECGWPTFEAFEQAIEEPALRPQLLGAVMSRLTVSQSELRKMKNQGILDQRPMEEWVKDVHRTVSLWYSARNRQKNKIAEYDRSVEKINQGLEEAPQEQKDDLEDFDFPALRGELVAELDLWTAFLEPLGADTCPFRVTDDDFLPDSDKLKPTFAELTPALRLQILDALCHWNIWTERKALVDALREQPDGTPGMRARVLGHDEVGTQHLRAALTRQPTPLRVFREVQTEVDAQRTELRTFQLLEMPKLKKKKVKKSASAGGNGAVSKVVEPEILRSSGRVRKPREIVHFGADTFFGKRKTVQEEMEFSSSSSEEDQDDELGRKRSRDANGKRRDLDRITYSIRDPWGPLPFKFETLTGDVVGMEVLIKELRREKSGNVILFESLNQIKGHAMAQYNAQVEALEALQLKIDTYVAPRAKTSRLAASEAEKHSEAAKPLDLAEQTAEDEKLVRQMEEDESRNAENQRLRSLRARPPNMGRGARRLPTRACRDRATLGELNDSEEEEEDDDDDDDEDGDYEEGEHGENGTTEEWACPRCTLLNAARVDVCGGCELKRGEAV